MMGWLVVRIVSWFCFVLYTFVVVLTFTEWVESNSSSHSCHNFLEPLVGNAL
jgi:hypothetical protein